MVRPTSTLLSGHFISKENSPLPLFKGNMFIYVLDTSVPSLSSPHSITSFKTFPTNSLLSSPFGLSLLPTPSSLFKNTLRSLTELPANDRLCLPVQKDKCLLLSGGTIVGRRRWRRE